MIIDKNITDYLKCSANFNNSIILLTDNTQIIYNSYSKTNNTTLPKDYLNHINEMNKKNLVLEVYNSYKFKLLQDNTKEIKNQCIALILDENKIIGSLIILNHNLDFECSNYVFMSTLLRTIKIMLKNTDNI